MEKFVFLHPREFVEQIFDDVIDLMKNRDEAIEMGSADTYNHCFPVMRRIADKKFRKKFDYSDKFLRELDALSSLACSTSGQSPEELDEDIALLIAHISRASVLLGYIRGNLDKR